MARIAKPRGYSRAGIERIRATINTAGAIADLWEIGHDRAIAPGVRVKALCALLNKTMPDLVESHNETQVTHRVLGTASEQMAQMIRLLGREAVALKWPDLLARYEAGTIDAIPAAGKVLPAPVEGDSELPELHKPVAVEPEPEPLPVADYQSDGTAPWD